MKIIILFSCFLATANTELISTGGLGVVLILMPLRCASFPLDMLEDDVGLLPEKVVHSTSAYDFTTRALDWKTKLIASYKTCEEITGISSALVKEFRSGIWKPGPLIQDWALCVLNKMDLMTLQGVFRYDTALEYIRRDVGHGAEEVKKASVLINKCLTEKLLTPVQIAWEYLRCHRRRDDKKKYPSLSILLDEDLPSIPSRRVYRSEIPNGERWISI